MKRLKEIFVISLATTAFWVFVIAMVFLDTLYNASYVEETRYPDPQNLGALEWVPQKGEYVVRLIASNMVAGTRTVLYSNVSKSPEIIWFETKPMKRAK